MSNIQIVNHLYNIMCNRGSDAAVTLMGMGFVMIDAAHGVCLTDRGYDFVMPHL